MKRSATFRFGKVMPLERHGRVTLRYLARPRAFFDLDAHSVPTSREKRA
jgi:hypothetical protein